MIGKHPDPDAIPAGSLCIIDTNVLVYAEEGASAQAQRLLRRCSVGDLTGVLPQTVWQELCHRLMLAEALARGLKLGRHPAAALGARPAVVRSFSVYRQKISALVELGLRFEPCTRADLMDTGFRMQERYGLLTSDAVVLAVALRVRADALVSSDAAFQPVEEIPVYSPSDLPR